MALGTGDALILSGTLVFGMGVLRVLEGLISAARESRKANGKKSEPPPPPPQTTGQRAALDADCRDRIVETHVLVETLTKSEERQTELLQKIGRNTDRMANSLDRMTKP